jgi:1,4-alpha-glucan branching enzyme
MNPPNPPVTAGALPQAASEQKPAESKPRAVQTPFRRRAVRFEVEIPRARYIAVAGTFNGWDPADAPLVFIGGNKWYNYLLLSPGRYEYRLVVDGQWIDPPQAKAYVPNPYGSRNAVMEV